MNNEVSMIMTTVKDRDEAKILAKYLIEERYAACIQEISINSYFNWDGKMNDDPEILLLIKTANDRVEAAIDAIKSKHSYDTPEILVSPIIGGLAAYMQWVKSETR